MTIIIIALFAIIALFIIAMGVLAYHFEPDTDTYTYMDLIRAWRDSKKKKPVFKRFDPTPYVKDYPRNC